MPETLSSSEPWTNCHPDSSSEPGDAATSSRSGSGSGTERLAAGFGGDRRRAAGDIGAGRVGGGGVEREGNGLPLTDSLFISSTMAGGVGAAVGLGGGPPPDSLVGVAYTCIDRGGLGAEVGFGGGGEGMLVLLHHLTTAGLVAVSAAVCPAWRTGSVLFLGPAQDAQATFQSKNQNQKTAAFRP